MFWFFLGGRRIANFRGVRGRPSLLRDGDVVTTASNCDDVDATDARFVRIVSIVSINSLHSLLSFRWAVKDARIAVSICDRRALNEGVASRG